jgi:integrase
VRNLIPTEIRAVAGEETQTQEEVKGKIIQFIWKMQKDNYSKATITTYGSALERLVQRGCNLLEPEAVKETLAKMRGSEAYKYIIAAAYSLFLKEQGLTWKPPICHVNRPLPFIPTERELDDLIAGCGRKTAAFLQCLKETAMRMGECSRLTWANVDTQRKMITLNDPEKSGNPRIFDVSGKLVSMLAAMPKTSEYVFGTCSKVTRGTVYYRLRKNLARKLGNPRLLNIGLHTFRHWKATALYHETKNPVLVKEFLGHRSLDTTLLYIQLEKHLYKEELDTFTVTAVKNADEIPALLEVGFEYHCEKDGLMFFRKRK